MTQGGPSAQPILAGQQPRATPQHLTCHRQQKIGADQPTCGPQRDDPRPRESHGQRQKQKSKRERQNDVAGFWPSGQAEGCVAKQGRGPNIFCTRQGPKGENGGCQYAIKPRLHQGCRIKLDRNRHRQRGLNHRRKHNRNGRADGQTDEYADGSQQGDLQEIDLKDCAPFCANGFQCRDDGHLFIKIGPHGRRHTDPANDQAGQSHEHQKIAQPLDKSGHARRTVSTISPPSATFDLLACLPLEVPQIGIGRQGHPVGAVKQCARL